MKNGIPYIIIAALLVVIFWQNSCEPKPKEPRVVVVPEQSGTFKPKEPVQTPAEFPKGEPKTIIKWKEKTIEIENPVNLELLERYVKSKDSIARLKVMIEAITERAFNEAFEDSLVKITIKGSVYGKIKEFKPDYTIKEQKIELEREKEVAFRLMGGFEFGNTLQFDSFMVKGNVGFQNKKGNIFTASFDTEQRIWVGYNFSVFSIKK